MNQTEINEAVEKHNKWLHDEKGGERWVCNWNEDLSGANLSGANLYGADLSGANLTRAYLYGADLSGANLTRANLTRANLRGANLTRANLSGANLYGADLYGADLSGANLSGANLYGANLSGANLTRAYLYGADLSGANLSGANLTRANLSGANLTRAYLYGANLYGADLYGAESIPELVCGMTLIATPDIKTGWKKLNSGLICRVEIPEEAKRSNATSRKCRCEFAKVVEIWDGDKPVESGYTDYPGTRTEYRVGEIVRPDSFDDDRWNECSHGIHFFLTRVEAENY